MKNIRQIFKDKDYLLKESEVEQLITYCEGLQDEIVEFKFEKEKSKEKVLLEIIREISNSCQDIQKQQHEHERFDYEAPDYRTAVLNLKKYLDDRCREERIYF
ncbi:hypothetical protein [Flavobacterium sp.]|jgi:uncharacterized tellurite resistance protein B-like protein|uniref:hypothetical protein n=1 Tax=Flavobacterium sp. TaxID=239 RepID=UPI003BD394FA